MGIRAGNLLSELNAGTQYQLVEEYNQELDEETNGNYVLITHKKMIEGKLRLVDLEMISLQKED